MYFGVICAVGQYHIKCNDLLPQQKTPPPPQKMQNEIKLDTRPIYSILG